MKPKSTYSFLIIILLLFRINCPAQDIIYKTSGDEQKAKVKEITLAEILYTHPDSVQGKTFSIAKEDVFMIKYGNGTTELIALSPLRPDSPDSEVTTMPSGTNMYLKGRSDARLYYKGKGVFWGSASAGAAAIFTGGTSLVVPVVLAATPPGPGSLHLPDPNLMRNQDYMNGYKKQAHRRKIGKAAAGTGTGIITSVALATVAIIAIFL